MKGLMLLMRTQCLLLPSSPSFSFLLSLSIPPDEEGDALGRMYSQQKIVGLIDFSNSPILNSMSLANWLQSRLHGLGTRYN